MVTKPTTDSLVPPPLSRAAKNPPYPTSPNEGRKNEQDVHDDREDSGSDWDKDSNDEEEDLISPSSKTTKGSSSAHHTQPGHHEALPEMLRVGHPSSDPRTAVGLEGVQDPLPDVLRVGSKSPSHSPMPSAVADQQPSQVSTNSTGSIGRKFSINNPYLRKQSTGEEVETIGSNTSDSNIPTAPSYPPPPPPITSQPNFTPVSQPSGTSLSDQDATQPQALLDGFPEMRQTPIEQQPPTIMSQVQNQHTGFSPIIQSNPWENEITAEEKWSDSSTSIPLSNETADKSTQGEQTPEAVPDFPPRNVWKNTDPSQNSSHIQSTEDIPPPQPPRPNADVTHQSTASRAGTESQTIRAQGQRNEHYSIKHINWFDEMSSTNPRRSPIILQNANGPCPLLALVNALVLSTPPGVDTDLIETLRVREQVSLGLLLDAVFEELMSGRRGDAAQELPDVGDLYSFLVTLHTGMNVNPCFASESGESSKKTGPTGPGSFEETREMRLYGTFAVPLLHGWLPDASSSAYYALQRSAPTYEDAQNVQFREEELEDKLRVSALTLEEQQIFEDVICIKEFLDAWPTQLTDFGLQVIYEHIKPGHFAILFRNDHFSTLYKEPRSGRLMTLVTDAGYSSHDEIVWESLADVSGSQSEFFSGDFRPVGNVQDQNSPTTTRRITTKSKEQHMRSFFDGDDEDDRWQTIPPRHGESSSAAPSGVASKQETGVVTAASTSNNEPSSSSAAHNEQEDHDLALALQLQEEEEDAHRRSQAARRREDDLSRRYISRDSPTPTIPGRDIRPEVPPRRSARVGNNNNAPPTRRPQTEGEDAPPPYEQAATDRPYVPGASPNPNASGRQRRQSAYGQQLATNSLGQGSSPVASGQTTTGVAPASPINPRRRGPVPVDQAPTSSGERPLPVRRTDGKGVGYLPPGEKCVVM